MTPAGYSEKVTFQIEVEVHSNSDEYLSAVRPGSLLNVLPQNPLQSCQALAKLMNLDLFQCIELRPRMNKQMQTLKKRFPFPTQMSVLELFQQYLDISMPPSCYMLQIMSHFATEQVHKDRLEELSDEESEQGMDDYFDYVVRERRSLIEVLQDFWSVHLPLSWLIEGTRLIRPRSYSVQNYQFKSTSNCNIINALHVILLVVMKTYTTKCNRQVHGLCTHYLSSLKPGDRIACSLAQGVFKFDCTFTPSIFISTGTGIAPFLCHFRQQAIKCDNSFQLQGEKPYLFHGCWKENIDFYYKEFLQQQSQKGQFRLMPAFSRDKQMSDNHNKVYVQNLISKNGTSLADYILNNKSFIRIFISGIAKSFPKQVQESLLLILEHKLQSKQKAHELLKNLAKNKQIQLEVWD